MDSRRSDPIEADGSAIGFFALPEPGFYTGVGSRSTPLAISREFTTIATRLAAAGWTLRSGAAKGADVGFERGVNDPALKEIYLPHDGFWGGLLAEGNRSQRRSITEAGVYLATPELVARASTLAGAVHPNWNAVLRSARSGSPFALQAHTRNAFQILGRDLETPSQFTVLWAPVKGDTVDGGTATALQLSRRHGIPTYNFAVAAERDAFYRFLDTIAPTSAPSTTPASTTGPSASGSDPDLFHTAEQLATAGERVAIVIPTNMSRRTNGDGIMGAGLALQARERFAAEHLERELGAALRRSALPSVLVAAAPERGIPYDIIAFHTKHDPREPASLDLIGEQARALGTLRAQRGYDAILMPRVGAGLGQQDWSAVKAIIAKEASAAAVRFLDELRVADAAVRAGPSSASPPTRAAPTGTTDASSPFRTDTTRTPSTMSIAESQERFHLIRDPDTRLIASTLGRLGGVYSSANAEWIFPGSDYISRSGERKTSTGVSDKADGLLELYHATRPTAEQMQQLQQLVNTMPYELLGITAPRGSVQAKKAIAALLNPNSTSITRAEFIIRRSIPYLTPASEKQVDTIKELIANGYDIIAWRFDAKAEPDKVWAYDGAPRGVGKTVGRARELMNLATPYVEADRRRRQAEAEKALLTGDLEGSNGAINYAQVDTSSPEQLNVLRRIESEAHVADRRLADLDVMREHRAEQNIRREHNERTTDDDSREMQRSRGFDGDAGQTALARARGNMDYVLREYLEMTTAFKGSDIVLRDPRATSKLSGTVVQFIKVDDKSDDHFLAAVQHAGAKIETPAHFAIHREDGTYSIAYNLGSNELRALQSNDEVFKVIGPVTYADAVAHGEKHELKLTSEPEEKRGPITEKPSRTFTIIDSRTFDRPVETGAPVRLQFGEPEPTHHIVLDLQQRYSIVSDRDPESIARLGNETLIKVAGPFSLERARAYADANQLTLVDRPNEELAPVPALVTFAGIGQKTREAILGLDPESMRATWGFSPVVHETPAGASEPIRHAVSPPEQPDFWRSTSREEAVDLIRRAADIDPMIQARDDAKHALEQKALAAAGGEGGRVAAAAEIPLPRREDKTVEGTIILHRDGIVAIDRGFNRFSVVRESEVRGNVPDAGKAIKLQSHADRSGFDVVGAKVSRRVSKS